MATPAQPCTCVPNTLLCCCGPQNGISIVQPSCQTLPGGAVVNNPAYAVNTGKSYWTYKFLTDCGGATTKGISNFGIPICASIPTTSIVVSERIDGCGDYVSVPFTLTSSDPNLGAPPVGFQWLKVETQGRYDKGVCVEYRVEIAGDFPADTQPIAVKAGTAVLTFNCGCFQVPKCQPQGQLSVNLSCSSVITNNLPTLLFAVDVSNVGEGPLENVLYQDTINVPSRFILGTPTVTPADLTIDTSTPGLVKVTGNLGNLAPGQHVPISYSIPVANITGPGHFTVLNSVIASATGTQATGSCSHVVEAVQLSASKCCRIDGHSISYQFTIGSISPSPDTVVNILDQLTLPPGVTVEFTNFSGCDATFADSANPVPRLTPVSGPATINIHCNNASIPAGASAQRQVVFNLLSSSVVGSLAISNALQQVTPSTPDTQVFMGTVPALPISATNNVTLTLQCQNPC